VLIVVVTEVRRRVKASEVGGLMERGLLLQFYKWKVRLAVIWLSAIVLALIILLLVPSVYTCEALISPIATEKVVGRNMELGGGDLVGRILGATGGSLDSYATISYLRSRAVADMVIREMDLKKRLFPKRWDEKAQMWRGKKGEPSNWDARADLDSHMDVYFDEYTGQIHLAVHWENPQVSFEVAKTFLQVSSSFLKNEAIEEGERRILELIRELEGLPYHQVQNYLYEELTRAHVVLASIRASADYAWRVVDPPVYPEEKSWPPRALILVTLGVMIGLIELGIVSGVYLSRTPEAKS
jgi:uncharacterized protein involved in exopolysaccharide biosynthesis